MPNIRVMVWNIRKFGQASTQIPGMLTALSRIIRGADPDLVVILEVVEVTGAAGLAALCNQLRADDFPNNHWRGMLSYSTGAERYAFICRDRGLVRPLEATATTNDTGSAEHPVRNLDAAYLTMLADPRAPVHAVSDIVPVTSLSIPPVLADPAVGSMALLFDVSPALTVLDPGAPGTAPSVAMPTPATRDFSWSWLEPGAAGAVGTFKTVPPAPGAAFPTTPPTLRSGWLRLSPDPGS